MWYYSPILCTVAFVRQSYIQDIKFYTVIMLYSLNVSSMCNSRIGFRGGSTEWEMAADKEKRG